jgi:DNA (cytosine-5)-methyltransferase 1
MVALCDSVKMLSLVGLNEKDEETWALASHLLNGEKNVNKLLRHVAPSQSKKDMGKALSKISKLAPQKPFPDSQKRSESKFTFMDLFAGIGGFHIALTKSGGECVFASEIDSSAKLTYAMNFGVVPFGDIRRFTRNVDGEPLSIREIRETTPKADLIAGGFPCQPFSKAGVSSRNHHGIAHGLLCEAQGTLFEDILLLARAHKPKILLLENVANLSVHDEGNTIRVIRSEIKKAGYEIFPRWNDRLRNRAWGVIDSQSVVAQRRRRVYMVCVRKDLIPKYGEFELPDFTVPASPFRLRDVLAMDDISEREKIRKYAISSNLWKSHLKRERAHIAKGNGFRIGIMNNLDGPAPTLVARYFKDGKDCLIPNKFDGGPPRMLTPRECAFLQTFPKDFWIPEFKTPAYKQFGNAITVKIAEKIARKIAKQYF